MHTGVKHTHTRESAAETKTQHRGRLALLLSSQSALQLNEAIYSRGFWLGELCKFQITYSLYLGDKIMKAPVMSSPRNNDRGSAGCYWGESPPVPRSHGTMRRSRTIKTKSDGPQPGRRRRCKRPLWRVKIVPSSRATSKRHDLKGEKLDGGLVCRHSRHLRKNFVSSFYNDEKRGSDSDSLRLCNLTLFIPQT